MENILKLFWGKAAWHLNDYFFARPWLLNLLRAKVTVLDHFGSPGDTLLTGIVCRELKRRYPRLRINCLTKNPSLLEHDPAIASLNRPKNFFHFNFNYLGVIDGKDGHSNVLKPALTHLGIADYEYKARVYLTEEEHEAAKKKLAGLPKPWISINVLSKELVKIWPVDYWRELVDELAKIGTVIHLGNESEPPFEHVVRLAGKLSLRESMAVLAQCDIFVGGVTFLMHAANGSDVPGIIIFGGREKPANSGYALNSNLSTDPECSPCWLHTSRGDICPHQMKCMTAIKPNTVMEAVVRRLASEPRPAFVSEPIP